MSLFWEWMNLRPKLGTPVAEAVCAHINNQVTVGIQPRVTYNPLWSRQETAAAAEYVLFLASCRRQTGATLRKRGLE